MRRDVMDEAKKEDLWKTRINQSGEPESGGLTVNEALSSVRINCHELNVVGFEIVETAPNNDSNYVTALTANRIIIEAITGIAMQKFGIEGPYYLDPVTPGEVPFSLL
jgi:hypothetical protein